MLPKTNFPLRINPVQHEPAIQRARQFDQLYQWQINNRPSDRVFTLHDGPPFANGDLHMGHVLNKVLKDIINRYKLMKGYRIQYRPGWDCHGLPIEIKACQSMPSDSTAVDIRKSAKDFAKKAIKSQKKSFINWGLLGDWDNPYLTMSREYESNQIDVFYDMYKQGCIYRGYKPVYWSPSTHTALAEAELEYQQHTSSSVYLLFRCIIPSLSSYGDHVYSLVWTTTPWTLPANKAICFNPDHTYVLIKQLSSGRLIIVGGERLSALSSLLGEYEVITHVPGTALDGSEYTDLFNTSLTRPFIPGDHVTSNDGTGLVHTAPAHGFEDYKIGLKHGLDLACMVDENGKYQTECELSGMEVLGNGNETVINNLRSNRSVLHEESYSHRYPYDWRSKKPVIIRSTRQWFASIKSLKERAISALNRVESHPSGATRRIIKMVEDRDEWCISRQRVWGVPVPVFFPLETMIDDISTDEEYIMTDESIDHIKGLFSKHGSDCWWLLPIDKLLPPSLSHMSDRYVKGEDTMDVWFDSGSSWASVLPDGVSDMYLEGKDQYRGWFQSSLLTSVAIQGQSPYKEIVSHGFVLDKGGVKMSKSLGNVMTPDDIINRKGLGVDTMRLWVTSGDFTSDLTISEDILDTTNDFLQKLRITFRYLLGNLSGFDSDNIIPYDQLPSLDKYLLHKLHHYYSIAEQSYDSLVLSKLHHTLVNYIRRDLSAFYLDIVKDRLYCDSVSSLNRQAALTVLHHHLVYLLTSLGPVLPHLVEEVAMYYLIDQGLVCMYSYSIYMY